MFKNFNAPLFQAMCGFFEDNGLKPFVSIATKGVSEPGIAAYARNGTVVLNFSQKASRWSVTDNGIDYRATFGGVHLGAFFAWEDVIAIWDGTGKVQGGWGFATDHFLDLRGDNEETAVSKPRLKLRVIDGGKE